MSTKQWPKIKPTQKNGKRMFLADARIAGEGERKFFATRGEAETWAQLQRIRRQNEGNGAFDDTELSTFGWSIADAIKFSIEHLRRQSASVTIQEGIDSLVESKRAAGMTSDYCRDIGSRCGKLLPTFEGRKLATITTQQIDAFLSGLAVAPGTRNTIRRDICTLWSFGAKRGWCRAEVATSTEIAKTSSGAIGILTPEQLARLLSECDSHTIPAVALSAFCGLRQTEVEQIDWSAVDIEERVVTVDASIAKTASRRTVEIPENAVEWLRPYARKEGGVMAGNYRNAFDRGRVRAGFRPSFLERADAELQRLIAEAKRAKHKLAEWPANGLRHSAISYKLARSRDIARVATESGNSPAVIRSHYLELVKPSAAVAYFSIRPTSPSNVLAMNAA